MTTYDPKRRWAYALDIDPPHGAPVLFIGTHDEAEAYLIANGRGQWSFTGVPEVAAQITDATTSGIVPGIEPGPGLDLCYAFQSARLP